MVFLLRKNRALNAKTMVLILFGALAISGAIYLYTRSEKRQITTPLSPLKSESNQDNKDDTGRLSVSPESMDLEKWFELLRQNPDDRELWALELQRTKDVSQFVEESKNKPTTNKQTLEDTIVSNYQMEAKALYHLQNHQEALRSLEKSERILNQIDQDRKCSRIQGTAQCDMVRELYGLTYGLFFNIYVDLKDQANTEKYLILLLEFTDESETFERYFGLIAGLYATNDNISQSLSILQKEIDNALASHKKERIIAAARISEYFFYGLFQRISWLPNNDTRRDYDSRDFADMFGLGIGRSNKYGMISSSEDKATFCSAVRLQEIDVAPQRGYQSPDEAKVNMNVTAYVRGQMTQGNFEPATKYLYCKYLDDNFYVNNDKYLLCPAGEGGRISFAEVKENLIRTPALRVADWTRDIIEQLEQGSIFLRKRCRT